MSDDTPKPDDESNKDKPRREPAGSGGIHFGDNAQVKGDVFTGDKHVTVHGDMVGGDQHQGAGLSAAEVAELFKTWQAKVEAHPTLKPVEKDDVKTELKAVQAEVTKAAQADENVLAQHLRYIGRMAPDILEVVTATLANPAAGFATVIRKVAERAKKE